MYLHQLHFLEILFENNVVAFIELQYKRETPFLSKSRLSFFNLS